MLQAKLPFSFIPIAIFPLVHSISVGLRLLPLSDVGVPKNALPNALTLLQTTTPFTLVNFAVYPPVSAFSVRLVILEVALILVPVAVPLHAPAVPIVIQPLAFVKSLRSVEARP
jgi:hypothetical protein